MQVSEKTEAGVARGARLNFEIIDTDVHETTKSLKDLLPYLDTHWRRYIEQYDWVPPSNLAYVVPTAGGNTRLDWKVPGTPMGSDLDLMRKQLFDGMGVDIGILDGFCPGQSQQGSYELAAAVASAYNDWEIATWLEPEPRLRGSIHVNTHDPRVAAHEIDRVASHPQMVQVFLPAVTNVEYGDPYFDPIYEAAVRNNLTVTMHHDGSTKSALGYPRYFVQWHMTAIPQVMMCQLANLVFGGVFDRFPDLKVVILEAGFSWLPHFMWRGDQQFRQLRIETPWVKRLPSRIVREQVRVATQPIEDFGKTELLRVIDQIGSEEVLVFSSDYPHWDSDDPGSALATGLPDALRARIFGQNARATFPRLRQTS